MDISSEVAELPWRRREQMSLGQSEWVRNAPIGVDAVYICHVAVHNTNP